MTQRDFGCVKLATEPLQSPAQLEGGGAAKPIVPLFGNHGGALDGRTGRLEVPKLELQLSDVFLNHALEQQLAAFLKYSERPMQCDSRFAELALSEAQIAQVVHHPADLLEIAACFEGAQRGEIMGSGRGPVAADIRHDA